MYNSKIAKDMINPKMVKDMIDTIVCNHKNANQKTLADWTIIVYFESKLMRFEIYRETFFVFHMIRPWPILFGVDLDGKFTMFYCGKSKYYIKDNVITIIINNSNKTMRPYTGQITINDYILPQDCVDSTYEFGKRKLYDGIMKLTIECEKYINYLQSNFKEYPKKELEEFREEKRIIKEKLFEDFYAEEKKFLSASTKIYEQDYNYIITLYY